MIFIIVVSVVRMLLTRFTFANFDRLRYGASVHISTLTKIDSGR